MKKILTLLLLIFLVMPVGAEFGYSNDVTEEQISNDAYDLALSYVGKPGDCFRMATLFLRDFYNDPNYVINVRRMRTVSYQELQPGDVIYYSSSSAGTTHWAVYLGNGKAFQGNWGSRGVIIGDVYYYGDGWSSPVFYHYDSYNGEEFSFSFEMLNF